MKLLKNILCFCLLALLPFSVIDAQKSSRKKNKTQTTARKSTGVKKKNARKKTVANKKSEQNNAANPMGATLRLAEQQQKTADTTVPKTVTVTSVFKPFLKTAAKINFTAATPVIDSSRIAVSYQIPAQNLFFNYAPVAVKPLMLETDSALAWQNDNFIKAGFGNFSSPYIESGITFGNNPSDITSLHGKYISSKGNLPYQEFYKANIEGTGNYSVSNRLNLFSKLYYNHSTQYKYGTAAGVTVPKDNLLQQFNLVGLNVGIETKAIDSLGITYRPELGASYFSDNRGGSEFTFQFNGSVNKSFTNALSFDLGLNASLTGLKQPQAIAAYNNVSNNLYTIKPSLHFITPNVKLKAGFDPSWDNSRFALLPNITAEARLSETNVTLEVGWLGYFNKNTYQSLSVINPYIAQPGALFNTKNIEQYVGIKTAISKQLSFNARFSLLKTNNLPLFVNDTVLTNRQTFITLFEPELKGFKLHAELNYTVQDNFFGGAAFNFTNYSNQQLYAKTWGFLPLELTGYLKYRITKDFLVKGDVFFWDGTYYKNPSDGANYKLNPAADLSLGAEFTIVKHLNLWVQMSNIFNNRYQRWNQYEVLGFNVLGGIVYSFR